MNHDEAILVAKQVASEEGWEWLEPVDASKSRSSLFGPDVWTVITNAACIGRNIRIVIDDTTRQVVRKAFLPR
jgi:hypothetical protein